MKIALVSLDQAWKDKLANKAQCRIVVEDIKTTVSDIDLIIFPELTLIGFCVDDLTLAENGGDQSDTVSFFSALSRRHQCYLVFGQLARLPSGQVVNRQNITNRGGQLISAYDKVHTFSYAGENNYITQGETPSLAMIDDVSAGMTICYDLRFSELYHYYRNKADMVINTANWPSTRTSQWLCLLQARAIENQYFVVGVNRVGIDGKGLVYDNSSVIFNPLGEKLSPQNKGPCWDVYDVDTDEISALIEQFPFIKDRRESLYDKWVRQDATQ
jgi:predicted amidohydrolase